MVEMYFAKTQGVKYWSRMYDPTTNPWYQAAWDGFFWNEGTHTDLVIYGSDWDESKVKNNNTGKRVGYYNYDGTVATSLTTGQWYKIVIPKMKNISSTDSICKFCFRTVTDGDSKVAEVYYRNVSYGDTIPAGWINE